jgi:hypothetical protein
VVLAVHTALADEVEALLELLAHQLGRQSRSQEAAQVQEQIRVRTFQLEEGERILEAMPLGEEDSKWHRVNPLLA